MKGTLGTVLVVDDDGDVMTSVCDALAEAGYESWPARDADDALHLLGREERPPSMVLLDLNMPGMSVVAFLSEARRREGWAQVRYILMTGVTERDIPKALAVDAVLLKPFSLEVFLATVRQVAEPRPAQQGKGSPAPGVLQAPLRQP